MKKIISATVAILMLMLSLVGCSNEEPEFDMLKERIRIRDNGYSEVDDYGKPDYHSIDYSAQYTEEIASTGGSATVNVVINCYMVKDVDPSFFCLMIKFETTAEASAYAQCRMKLRDAGSDVKIAQTKENVVITNATDVQKNLNLEFK